MSQVGHVRISGTISCPHDVIEFFVFRDQTLNFWVGRNGPITAHQTLNLRSDFGDDSVIVLIEHSLARSFESCTKPPARASLTAKQQGTILHIVRRTGTLVTNFLQASKELLPGGDVSLFHVRGLLAILRRKLGTTTRRPARKIEMRTIWRVARLVANPETTTLFSRYDIGVCPNFV